jgi:hypothetical protein
MTNDERILLSKEPIVWQGDLLDDCTAEWAGLMLRAEWMDRREWWWAVYDMQDNEVTVDSSNEYTRKFHGGDIARAAAEQVAKTYISTIDIPK